MSLAVGIDIGGTKVAGGVLDDRGRFLARSRQDTPHLSKAPQVVEDTICAVVDDLRAQLGPRAADVTAVGVGAAGFVSADRRTVLFAPHLSWRNEPLRDRIADRVGLPIVVDNDANAACWAEHRFGAGRGESHLIMVTLGTGIGGGLLIDGRLQRGRFGLAGEYGHMTVVPGGHRCECGNRGCWEQYSSGNALVREARSLLDAESPVAHDLLARLDGDPCRLTGPLITEAAQAGDPVCIELIAEIGQWLGRGLADLAAAFDPGLFVVGGGVSAAGELLLGPARDELARSLTGRGYRPVAPVVGAALGNDAGLIGAADLARTAA